MNFDFKSFSQINANRAKRWHSDFGPMTGEWSGADWSNAFLGEAGEAANFVKKLRRVETGLVGNRDQTYDDLKLALAFELADAFTYMDLLATYYEIDLPAAIVVKFNEISERNGFPERIDLE